MSVKFLIKKIKTGAGEIKLWSAGTAFSIL